MILGRENYILYLGILHFINEECYYELSLKNKYANKDLCVCVCQALKHLRSVQVINFGDCLVRSEGAIAIAETLRDGLPILKVLTQTHSCRNTEVLKYIITRNAHE